MMKISAKNKNRYQPLKIPNPMLRLAASRLTATSAARATYRATYATAVKSVTEIINEKKPRCEKDYHQAIDRISSIDAKLKKKLKENTSEMIESLGVLVDHILEKDVIGKAYATIEESKELQRFLEAANREPSIFVMNAIAKGDKKRAKRFVVEFGFVPDIKIRDVDTGEITSYRDV